MANHHTKEDQNQQRQEQQQQQRHQGVENGTLTLSRDKGHPACEPTECRPPGGSETRGCRGAGSQGGCACGRGTWAAETPGWRRWTSTDQPERSGWSHTTHERRTLVSARWVGGWASGSCMALPPTTATTTHILSHQLILFSIGTRLGGRLGQQGRVQATITCSTVRATWAAGRSQLFKANRSALCSRTHCRPRW
jgi:hypothetical protein